MPLGSFGVFETFRILIPGYLASFYAGWYLALFFPKAAGYLVQNNLSTVTFIGFGLLVGLLLYLQKKPIDPLDVKQLLPSKHILQRAAELNRVIDLSEATNLYFYMLNNFFSDPMRERIFFYGNIYRVAQKTWYLSRAFIAFSILTWLAEFACFGNTQYLTAKISFIVALTIVWYYAQTSAAVHYKEILRGQIKWLQMRKSLVDALITSDRDDFSTPSVPIPRAT